eukprot:gnl/Carplike_NY0171/3038_a4084_381.p1 GENE.gnl/Carplike_NY0171/3038_a4084_381~~gnl/Carplike_NY0171/3038_a4084_381.p1  ORF type:complete len:327 (-),score=136.35 gnl/Carplike_NY0171/3038_a4084_381:311-1186(-)
MTVVAKPWLWRKDGVEIGLEMSDWKHILSYRILPIDLIIIASLMLYQLRMSENEVKMRKIRSLPPVSSDISEHPSSQEPQSLSSAETEQKPAKKPKQVYPMIFLLSLDQLKVFERYVKVDADFIELIEWKKKMLEEEARKKSEEIERKKLLEEEKKRREEEEEEKRKEEEDRVRKEKEQERINRLKALREKKKQELEEEQKKQDEQKAREEQEKEEALQKKIRIERLRREREKALELAMSKKEENEKKEKEDKVPVSEIHVSAPQKPSSTSPQLHSVVNPLVLIRNQKKKP